ncbi:RluA family pseudouridine synthase [bacterium]|nr:RluA family pseudouridine synthase [bacterium]
MEPGETIELTVEAPAGDILGFLADALPQLPLNVLRRIVARGRVVVEGRRVDHLFEPQAGQTLTLQMPEHAVVQFRPEPLGLEVLYEDEGTLAINKPSGLTVIPGPGTLEARFINGLLHYVRTESPLPAKRIYVVHRLDKETSGVVLVAKTVHLARHLSACFEDRRVRKIYWAVVRGQVAQDEGEVDRPLAQHNRGRMRLRDRRGKPSQSSYRVLERYRSHTFVEVRPHTGRQHQVRLHMSAIGHPLAVDRLYGGAEALYLSEIKPGYRPKAKQPERPIIDRLTLHAQRVEVDLPDGSPLVVEAPLPKDLERLFRSLRKYARK